MTGRARSRLAAPDNSAPTGRTAIGSSPSWRIASSREVPSRAAWAGSSTTWSQAAIVRGVMSRSDRWRTVTPGRVRAGSSIHGVVAVVATRTRSAPATASDGLPDGPARVLQRGGQSDESLGPPGVGSEEEAGRIDDPTTGRPHVHGGDEVLGRRQVGVEDLSYGVGGDQREGRRGRRHFGNLLEA